MRAKTAQTGFAEGTQCEANYIGCTSGKGVGQPDDTKKIVFFYDEAGKEKMKTMCDQKDKDGKLLYDCEWY